MKVNIRLKSINDIKHRVHKWNNYRARKTEIINSYIDGKRLQRSVEFIIKHIYLTRTVSNYMQKVSNKKRLNYVHNMRAFYIIMAVQRWKRRCRRYGSTLTI